MEKIEYSKDRNQVIYSVGNIEITLSVENDGLDRDQPARIEPVDFSNLESQNYYSENWETIEEKILDHL